METWAYKRVEVEEDPSTEEARFDEQGKEGWELVSVLSGGSRKEGAVTTKLLVAWFKKKLWK